MEETSCQTTVFQTEGRRYKCFIYKSRTLTSYLPSKTLHLYYFSQYSCKIYTMGHIGPVVACSPADREVRGSDPTLAKCEFLRAQEMSL